MKLILKHILRSIRSSPAQPLLILFTVSLSMAIATTVLSISLKQNEVSRELSYKEKAIGDLLVTTRADSAARILFTADVEEHVKEQGDVTGEFSLVGFLDTVDAQGKIQKNAVSVSATDLVDMDRFYQFEYLSYGSFREETLRTTAIVSQSFADRMALSVGDELTVRLVGEEMTYTVQAIAKDDGIFYERDMLISFSGLSELITRKIPSIAILGDSFTPCSRVMVKVHERGYGEEIFQRLSEDPLLSDKSVVLTEDGGRAEFWIFVRSVALCILTVLVFLLSAFLIGTSLTLLNQKRKEELALFRLVGAAPRQTRSWRCLECAIYALLGVGVGALLAVPLTRGAGYLFSWNALMPRSLALAAGGIMALVLMAICTLRHVFESEKESKPKRHVRGFFKHGNLWLLAALCISIPFVPIEYRYLPCFFTLIVLVWIAFQLAPALLRWITKRLEAHQQKKDVPNAVVLLSVKSLRRHSAYSFSCALLAVMLSILSVITVSQRALTEQVDIWCNGFHADIVAYGMTDRAEDTLLTDADVEATMRVYYNTSAKLQNGSTAIAISVKGPSAYFIDDAMRPHALPEGKQVVLSAGLAALTGIDVGDSIPLTVGGVEETFVVSEILQVNNNTFYFDSDAIGIRKNIVFVKFKETASYSETMEQASLIIGSYGALVSDLDSIFGYLSTNLGGYSSFLVYAILASFLLVSVGIMNLLIGLSDKRKQEYLRLQDCGTSQAMLRKIKAFELLLLFSSAAAVALVFGTLLCVVVDLAMRSFGILLFVF